MSRRVDGECNCDDTPSGDSGNAYALVPGKVAVTNLAWQSIGGMAWLQSEYSTYTSGIAIFSVVYVDRTMDIRVQDVTSAVTLGQSLGIAASGVMTFNLTSLPVVDSEIEIQVQKSVGGGTSAILNSFTLEFSV